MGVSESAYYDVAVSLGKFVREKSSESQTVTYEDFRLSFSFPKSMENIPRYFGGGGVTQTTYFRNTWAAYQNEILIANKLTGSANGNFWVFSESPSAEKHGKFTILSWMNGVSKTVTIPITDEHDGRNDVAFFGGPIAETERHT